MNCVTGGARTAYPSGAPTFIPGYLLNKDRTTLG
jgi:hypothetical protein